MYFFFFFGRKWQNYCKIIVKYSLYLGLWNSLRISGTRLPSDAGEFHQLIIKLIRCTQAAQEFSPMKLYFFIHHYDLMWNGIFSDKLFKHGHGIGYFIAALAITIQTCLNMFKA